MCPVPAAIRKEFFAWNPLQKRGMLSLFLSEELPYVRHL